MKFKNKNITIINIWVDIFHVCLLFAKDLHNLENLQVSCFNQCIDYNFSFLYNIKTQWPWQDSQDERQWCVPDVRGCQGIKELHIQCQKAPGGYSKIYPFQTLRVAFRSFRLFSLELKYILIFVPLHYLTYCFLPTTYIVTKDFWAHIQWIQTAQPWKEGSIKATAHFWDHCCLLPW